MSLRSPSEGRELQYVTSHVCKAQKKGANNTMGRFVNPGSSAFQAALNASIYVDKTELIQYTNQVFRTKQKFLCVSRPRRFGKTVMANMITAFLGKKQDSDSIFKPLKISQNNLYNNVFKLNIDSIGSAYWGG